MDPRIQLLLWLALSLVAGLGASVAYRARGERYWHDDAAGTFVGDVALFVYYIGLPFVALIAGSLSLDLLGFGTEWFRTDHLAGFTLGEWLTSIAIALGALLLVGVVLTLNRRALDVPAARESILAVLRDTAYDEVHWALYRAPFVLLFADAFFGAVAGIVVVLGERFVRQAMTHAAFDRSRLLVTVLCTIVSAFLFVTTRNIWLMMAADLALRIGVNRALIATIAPQPHASSR